MKRIVTLMLMAAVCQGAKAETWYLTEDGTYIANYSKWTNLEGTASPSSFTSDDELVVPSGKTLRIGASTTTAKSVTIQGSLTVDGANAVTFSNDGIFFDNGSYCTLNTWKNGERSFENLHTVPIKGKVTILSTSSRAAFSFNSYDNLIYQLDTLIGAEGTSLMVRDDNSGVERVNDTFKVKDASLFKGSITATYYDDNKANLSAPHDNGEFSGRVIFSQLDTPGTLTIGKNWVLGSVPNEVTRAANVNLGDGARLEVMLSENDVSRLEAASELTLGGNVQIFVTGSGELLKEGRYAVIVSPTAVTLDAFTLKAAPLYAKADMELELEEVSGIYTVYLKINDYGSYYVDAQNGSDEWDGSSPALPGENAPADGGVIAGPKRTLAAAMEIANFGSVVYAAEGVYDEGEMYADATTSNRVVVPVGVTLAAMGRRDKTIIKGKFATAEGSDINGCGVDALRCVALREGAVVKGFTLKDGRTAPSDSSASGNACGGAAWGIERGLLVDCVITNCGSSYRGDNFYGKVTLLRCKMYKRACGENLDFYYGGKAIDTIIHDSGCAYQGCEFVNCTFTDQYSVYGIDAAPAIVRNCLHFYGFNAPISHDTQIYNSYFCSKEPTQQRITWDETSRFEVSAEEVLHSAASLRPLSGSVAIGKGDIEMYLAVTNDWPVTMRREFTLKDIYGRDRFAGGALDLGAVQHRTEKVCRYVDAADGNDANDGLSAQSAKRTLKNVFESWEAEGDYEEGVVYAAPGEYDEGEMFYANCSNRVVVPPAMGLIATGGHTVTTIRGKFGDLDNESHAGAEAVRCVYLHEGAYIQGFTITGGSTQKSANGDWGMYGGGVYSDGGAVVACEITGNAGGGNNAEGRGPGGYGGVYIGSYIHGNYGSYEIHHPGGTRGTVVINSILTGTSPFYANGSLLNSTLVNGDNRSINGTYGISCAINCYLNKSGRGRCYTNCYFQSSEFTYTTSDGNVNNGYDEASCKFGIANNSANFDERKFPRAGSPVVDSGSLALYEKHFPAKWAQFKDVGFLGEQRVYNSAIDVGGGEYDVRGDFAKALNDGRKVEVKEVGANATLADGGIALPGGDKLVMDFIFSASGTATLSVTGEVTVTVDGVEIAPIGGVYAVNGVKGSSHSVKIVNRGEATALVSQCIMPQSGLRIIFR